MTRGKHGEQGLIRSPISDGANIYHEYVHPLHKSFHMLHIAACPLPNGNSSIVFTLIDSAEVTASSPQNYLSVVIMMVRGCNLLRM